MLSLKEALKRLYFLLVERREELAIVSPNFPKPLPRLRGPPEMTVAFKMYWNFRSSVP